VTDAPLRELLRVMPDDGSAVAIDEGEARSTPGVKNRKAAEREMADHLIRLEGLQERIYAEGTRSVLLVLQGMDTSGKDGTIRHVFSGVNPVGVRITNFKVPTPEERRHGFLWRIRRALPRPGEIGIFNRSQYEDVLIVRVHGLVAEDVWRRRYAQINRFEAEVAASGTAIVKCFLHLSYDKQRDRLLSRLDHPDKRWKFKEGDVAERHLWPDYQAAYRDALQRCSTEAAPWYRVPSDRTWYRNWAVGQLLVETLEAMGPAYPRPDLDLTRLRRGLAPPN